MNRQTELGRESDRHAHTYEFRIKHPDTNCPNKKDIQNVPVLASTKHEARVKYEISPVVCDRCSGVYQIKNVRKIE